MVLVQQSAGRRELPPPDNLDHEHLVEGLKLPAHDDVVVAVVPDDNPQAVLLEEAQVQGVRVAERDQHVAVVDRRGQVLDAELLKTAHLELVTFRIAKIRSDLEL